MAENEEYQQGYDADFEPELDKRYTCPVCLVALRDPVQTKCGHRFCQACLKRGAARWTRYGRCPVDNTSIDMVKEVFLDTAVQREVLSLTVLCENFDRECSWKGELRQLQEHVDDCPEGDVKCPVQGCRVVCRRSHLDTHREQCPYRLLPCHHCLIDVPALNMTKHQLLACQKFPVSCGVCGATDIIRDDISRHISPTDGDCPLVTVKCQFFDHGCYFQDKRMNMAEHEKNAVSHHMLLLTTRCTQQDEVISEAQQMVNTIAKRLEDVSNSQQESSRLLDEQKNQYEDLEKQVENMSQRLSTVTTGTPRSFLWNITLPSTTTTDKQPRQYTTTSPPVYTDAEGNRFKLVVSLESIDDFDANPSGESNVKSSTEG